MKADTTAVEVLSAGTPQLSELGRYATNEMVGVTVLDMQFTSVAKFLGLRWDEGQYQECAQIAYDAYYWFTLAELKQFILRVKTGRYNSNKNISPAIMLEFMAEYAAERMECRYNHYSQQQKAAPLHPDSQPLTDEQMSILKNTIEDIAKSMGEPIRQIEDERAYQQERAKAHFLLMQKRVEADDKNG